ncbi:DUF2382 domain-containing protein [Deinococcus sp.]|uniref:DUF2382 domain-containing protein n=1 Tax=Deinococcus sp. TaxID=47478 RepID=UPI002869944B|nr:DUF2382 domain-containing protein [Deinococcus sp.]
MTDPPSDSERELLTTLELREEVLKIEKRRELIGQVEVRRERRVRSETVTVELVTEVLILSVKAGSGAVMIDGTALPAGTVHEVELYREEATPGKQVVVTQDVDILKERLVETTSQVVELAYEELVVNEIPTNRSTE